MVQQQTAQRDLHLRILATFSLAFAAGAFLLQYLLPLRWAIPCSLAVLAVGWLALLLPDRFRLRVILMAAGLSLGLGWSWLFARQVQQPMTALADTSQTQEMTVCAYPIPTEYGARVSVKFNTFAHGKVLYYGDETLLDLVPGQTIRDTVYIRDAARIKDEEVTTFTSKGIYLLCYSRGTPLYGPGSMEHPRWWPARLARAMQQTITQLFPGDTAAFLTAILTGDKHLLSEEAAADLSEAGLFHLLAVSGMHCGFLLAMITFVTGNHRKRLIAFLALPLLFFYAAMTGGSPSVLRACTMLSFLVLAPLANRDSDGLTSLSFALFLILLINPFAAASVSLQLSFAAMGGILLVTKRLYRLLAGGKKHGKCFSFIAGGFSTTVGALVLTTPLTAFYFGSLVLISPVSNLLCLWAASLVFISGLLAVLAGLLFPALGALIGVLPTLLIRYILAAAHLLAAIPFHAVYFSNPYLKLWLVFVYLLFAAALLLKANRRRQVLLAAGLSLSTLVLTVFLGAARYRSALDAVVLDIGQGQCIALKSGRTFAVVDCGSIGPRSSSGEDAAHQLRTMGCTRLDYLLLTHFDYDHVSGIRGLMARLPVETLLIPAAQDDAGLRDLVLETARSHGTEVREVTSLSHLLFGESELTVYPPVGRGADNELGLTFLFSAGDQDFLVTGDMSAKTEAALLDSYSLPDVEAMMAGHHGAKASTSDLLLEQLTPEYVCISAGEHNRFHHPADDTLRRLAEHHCTVYRTDLQGDLHLTFNQGDHHGI